MFDLNEWRMFIAIPFNNQADRADVLAHPELFHFVNVDWATAEKIGKSPFSNDAMDTTGEYPIEPGEDPFFSADQVDILLKSLEKWRASLSQEDADSFAIVEAALTEAKGRGVGIYFKF